MATYHVLFNDATVGSTTSTVNVTAVESLGGLATYLQNMHGKLAREFSWPTLMQGNSSSITTYTATQVALESVRATASQNPSTRMFITWEG